MMTQVHATLRHETARIGSFLLAMAAGIGLLCLYLVALAWDPLDRRLGFYARRRAIRLEAHEHTILEAEAIDGAYGFVAAADGEDTAGGSRSSGGRPPLAA